MFLFFLVEPFPNPSKNRDRTHQTVFLLRMRNYSLNFVTRRTMLMENLPKSVVITAKVQLSPSCKKCAQMSYSIYMHLPATSCAVLPHRSLIIYISLLSLTQVDHRINEGIDIGIHDRSFAQLSKNTTLLLFSVDRHNIFSKCAIYTR